jgi:cell fate regulator YaaT (PSP1 superfamily)
MYKVIGIEFSNSNRIYFFDPKDINIKKNDKIIVETERGLQLGIAAREIEEVDEKKIVLPLKQVLRLATKDDVSKYEKNKKTEAESVINATKIANELELDMRFINANLTLDKSQLTLNFLADERIDFRELAKRLATIYKTRIELRQIGVRDKAKEIGGIGPCGRFLCCNTFLNDFNSVSINMAKNQYLSLNPTKINGICGRLLCCLKYEDDTYSEEKKNFPPLGTVVKVDGVEGKVVSHNIFKYTYIVEKKDKTIAEVPIEK